MAKQHYLCEQGCTLLCVCLCPHGEPEDEEDESCILCDDTCRWPDDGPCTVRGSY